MEGLPFFPEEFEFQLRKDRKSGKIDSGVRKQFKVLQVLIKRKDVGVVVHAGDADREGEVIIRNILHQAKNKKPVKRLWLPEQTEQTIRRGLSLLESDSKYDSLYNEGLARTYIDWLYGVNLTRLATLKSKSFLCVGRVIVPIVTAIYDRDMAIKTFKPEPYFALVSREKTKGIEIQLTSKRKLGADRLDEAAELCRQYNRVGAVVSDVKKEIEEIPPGKLYSLSKLQGFLGKKYRMTPAESMKVIQKLYENGYITYPRTNTEYLATAEQKKINDMIQQLRKLGYKVEPKNGAKYIYDDSKIESHSALTPTYRMPETDRLTDKEKLVYEAILRRFLAVFSEVPCKVERTKISINVGNSDGLPFTVYL